MGQYRLLRLGEQIRQEISTMILRHEIKDPRVSEFLDINRVEVAGDLAYAKVFVSSFMDDASVRRGVAGLQSAAGFIQSVLAKKITTYRFPKFTFIADFSMKDGYRMVQKLNELEKEESSSEEAESQSEKEQSEQE
ncbi:MAG: 30S ribosome-binding factor RbfA [Treponema sp.]|nr:30S ribosome-binding factor RbfA [Treponema sp.]